MLKLGFLLFLSIFVFGDALRTINSHLDADDFSRLNGAFLDGIKSNDLQSIFYSSLILKDLSKEDKTSACNRINDLHAESKLNAFEKNFYFVGAYSQLSCPNPVEASVLSAIKTSLSKDTTTAHELDFNYFSSKYVGNAIDEATKTRIVTNLQNILKTDDSLSNLGYAFNVAADLGTRGSALAKWIEGTLAQADEVDGKFLQFEGGLSITGLIINGILKLSKATQTAVPLSEDQLHKFSEYFLTRRLVQQAKGASILLDVLETISSDRKTAPICIAFVGNGLLQPDSQALHVKVLGINGKPLTPAIASLSASVLSKADNAVLGSKLTLTPKSTDKTVYELDLKSDSASAIQKQTVAYPNKISTVLNADQQQKILLKTLLVDEATGNPITVHQAFILFKDKSQREIIFVAEQDTSKAYKFDLDIGARAVFFNHRSGVYALELIVGDASLANSFRWNLADIELKFSERDSPAASPNVSRSPRPEITHKFREPEIQPAPFVSGTFTGMCVGPIMLLFFLWRAIGINVSNFTLSLSAIGFHLCFGAILGLFTLFWLQLNMFETLRLLIPLSIVTFLVGNRILRSLAKRVSDTKKND